MTWTALQVAEELVARVPSAGRLKLQKLLYFCQGHHLAQFDHPLFTEPIEAWKLGPVVRAVYDATPETGRRVAPIHRDQVDDEAVLNTIGYVASQYGRLSGRNLVDLTHAQEPWTAAISVARNQEIPVEAIREYFLRPDEEEDEVPADPRLSQDTIDSFIAAHPPTSRPARRGGFVDRQAMRELARSVHGE